MLFNSRVFLLFFACVLVLHHLPLPWRLRKANLVAASYLFYAAWNPPFVLLLVISTLADWVAARRIHQAKSIGARRGWLALSLSVNLGLLGFFKYSAFLVTTFAGALGAIGLRYSPPELDIVLPIGISFYTFQTLSYTLDVYRRKLEPWGSLVDYALYVTFFPQLVAGPIVRARDFLPQCSRPRRATLDGLAWGLALLVLGLFQKSVIADSILARPAEGLFDGTGQPGALDAWVGALAFSGQIFCDFAGYSTCAIGVALCLGFALPDNFHAPYAAIGFSDFWHRWHITLSTWLRDYLYISLGGSRGGTARTGVNLLITMFLGGLWHGAAWTFVAWGLLHGLYLVAERYAKAAFGAWKVWATPPGRLLLGLLTFALVTVAWVFFRSPSFERAFVVLSALAGLSTEAPSPPSQSILGLSLTLGTVAAIVAAHWFLRDRTLPRVVRRAPWPVTALALGGMLAAIVLTPGQDQAFIYFQF